MALDGYTLRFGWNFKPLKSWRFYAIEDPKHDRRDTNAVNTSDQSVKHTSRHTSETYDASYLINWDKEFISRVDVCRIDIIYLIYIVYGALNIDVGILVASFYDAPEAVALINCDLYVIPYSGGLSIASTDHGISGKHNDHDTDQNKQEEPVRLSYSVMMSSVLFHVIHHFLLLLFFFLVFFC